MSSLKVYNYHHTGKNVLDKSNFYIMFHLNKWLFYGNNTVVWGNFWTRVRIPTPPPFLLIWGRIGSTWIGNCINFTRKASVNPQLFKWQKHHEKCCLPLQKTSESCYWRSCIPPCGCCISCLWRLSKINIRGFEVFLSTEKPRFIQHSMSNRISFPELKIGLKMFQSLCI